MDTFNMLMRKLFIKIPKLIFILLGLGPFVQLSAQDTLLLTDHSKIGCNVVSIGKTTIEYHNTEGDTTVSILIKTTYVQYIFYKNGSVDTFNPVSTVRDTAKYTRLEKERGMSMYEMGRRDALTLYRSPHAPIVNGLSGLGMVYGIWVPLIYSWCKVNPDNINVDEYLSSTSEEYKRGFEKGASQKMHKQTWRSFAVGSGISLVGVVILIFSGY